MGGEHTKGSAWSSPTLVHQLQRDLEIQTYLHIQNITEVYLMSSVQPYFPHCCTFQSLPNGSSKRVCMRTLIENNVRAQNG